MIRNNAHPSSAPNSAAHAVNIFTLIRRRFAWIAFGLLLGVAAAALYCLKATVVYESTAELLVFEKNASLPAQGAQSKQSFDTKTADEDLATHMKIITSPRIVEEALERAGLMELRSIKLQLGDDETPVEYVCSQLEVDRAGDGSSAEATVIAVAFRHTDPGDCAEVLRAVIDSYQNFLGETVRGAGNEALDLIAKAKDDISTVIEQSELEYQTFRKASPLLWDGEVTKALHQARIGQFEHEQAEIKARRLEVQSRIELVNHEMQSSATDAERLALVHPDDVARLSLIIDAERPDPISEHFQAGQPTRTEAASVEFDKLIALRLDAKAELLKLGQQHPRVRMIKDQITELEDFIARKKPEIPREAQKIGVSSGVLMSAYVNLLEHDLKDLDRRETELQALIDGEYARATELVDFELKEDSLREQVDRNRNLYNAVLDRVREIDLLKDYGGYITEILNPVSGGRKAWPSLPLVLALGGLAGLFGGMTCGLVCELVDSAFRDPEDIRATLGYPILSHVPTVPSTKSGFFKRKTPAGFNPTLVTHLEPQSHHAEAFRGLRTAIKYGVDQENFKVLQVTSPCAADGKSTLISNLAITFAQSNKKVLLIDADLRRPRLHHMFGLVNAVGLADALTNQVDAADAIQMTEVSNLSLMPCGSLPSNPAELVSSPAFSELLDGLREEYDMILIDTPPVLAVSDPVAISSVVDYVLLHLKLSKHSRGEASQARDLLEAARTRLLGLTVWGTHANGKSSRYGGYRYGYSHKNYAYQSKYTNQRLAETHV